MKTCGGCEHYEGYTELKGTCSFVRLLGKFACDTRKDSPIADRCKAFTQKEDAK